MNDYRILVVDDEEDLCEILKFNLENEGYEVDTANSAEEALKMNIGSYNLLLLDVMMGEISGFKMAMLKWWTSKSMLYGTYFKSVISVTVLFPIPVCPVMWSFPSVFARLMMRWSLRRLIVWMVVCCLLPCFVPLI